MVGPTQAVLDGDVARRQVDERARHKEGRDAAVAAAPLAQELCFRLCEFEPDGAVEGAEAVLGVGVEDDVARRVQVPPARGVAQGDSRGVAEVDLALEEGRDVVDGAETFGDVGDDAGVSRERFVRVDVTLP